MKYCPYCGEKLDDSAVFCGNCGKRVEPLSAKQPEERKPIGYDSQTGKPIYEETKKPVGPVKKKPVKAKKKFHFSKKAGIIVGIVAAVAVCATAGFYLFQSPGDKFFLPQAELFEKKLKKPVKTMSGKYKDGFSSDFNISVDTSDADFYDDDDDIKNILDDSGIGLKIKEQDGTLLLNGNLNLKGSNVLSAQGTYSKGTVGFEIPEVDDHYYVMDLSKISENLFSREPKKKKTGTPIDKKDALKEVKKYYDILDKAVTKQNLTIVKNTTVSLKYVDRNEQNLFGVKVYQWKPTRGDLSLALTQAGNELENDTILQGWLNNIDLSAGEAQRIVDGYSSFDFSVSSIGKDLKKNASKWADQAVKDNFTWTMAKKGRDVVYINISYGDTELEYDRYEAGGEIRDAYALADKYSSGMMLNTFQKNKKDIYTGKMEFGTVDQVLKTEEKPYVTLDYQNADIDQTDVFGLPYGEYRISYPDLTSKGMEVSIHGGSAGAEHVITIPADYFNGNYSGNVKLKVSTTNRSSAQQPTGQKTDLSDYSEEEFEDLFNTIGSDVETIIDNSAE